MCKINFINKKNIVMILFQIKNILKNNYYHIKHLLSYPSNKDFKLLGSCFEVQTPFIVLLPATAQV
jgi:hypothetical protein